MRAEEMVNLKFSFKCQLFIIVNLKLLIIVNLKFLITVNFKLCIVNCIVNYSPFLSILNGQLLIGCHTLGKTDYKAAIMVF